MRAWQTRDASLDVAFLAAPQERLFTQRIEYKRNINYIRTRLAVFYSNMLQCNTTLAKLRSTLTNT
jgi:hypothetical protein